MAQTKHYSATALAFAKTLMELAGETGSESPIGAELAAVRGIITDNPTFGMYLADPSISHEKRGQKIKTIFGGRVSQLLLSTLGVMGAQGKLKFLPGLCDAYADLLEEKLGNIEVEITVAARLSDAELAEVRRLVGSALKKNAIVHQSVDESIIGGIILRVGDKLIDGSVKSQLHTLTRKMLLSRSR